MSRYDRLIQFNLLSRQMSAAIILFPGIILRWQDVKNHSKTFGVELNQFLCFPFRANEEKIDHKQKLS